MGIAEYADYWDGGDCAQPLESSRGPGVNSVQDLRLSAHSAVCTAVSRLNGYSFFKRKKRLLEPRPIVTRCQPLVRTEERTVKLVVQVGLFRLSVASNW